MHGGRSGYGSGRAEAAGSGSPVEETRGALIGRPIEMSLGCNTTELRINAFRRSRAYGIFQKEYPPRGKTLHGICPNSSKPKV